MLQPIVEVEVPRKPRSLRQARLKLGMSLRDLSAATGNLFGREYRVNVSQIFRAEHGNRIMERTASRLLDTLNYLYAIRDWDRLTLDDLALNISDRWPDEEEETEEPSEDT